MRLYNTAPGDDTVVTLKKHATVMYLGAAQRWTGSWWTHTFLTLDGAVVAWPRSTSMPIMNPVDKPMFAPCR